MMRRRRCCWCAVLGAILLVLAVQGAAQHRIAVFVQSAAAVPTADVEILRNYAAQRCSMITGAQICSQGQLMQAQRATGVFVGNSITVEGMRRLASTLGADYIVILRVVRWESRISYKPERSLLVLSATSFLDTTLQILVSPLGLLVGLERQATVSLFASVFNAQGDLRFTTSSTSQDRPLLSILTADPVEAAKAAVDEVMYQIAVAL